jgi:hypothetical protein
MTWFCVSSGPIFTSPACGVGHSVCDFGGKGEASDATEKVKHGDCWVLIQGFLHPFFASSATASV